MTRREEERDPFHQAGTIDTFCGSLRPGKEIRHNEEEGSRMGDEDAGARDAREDDGGGSVVEDSNEERVPRVARPPREPSRQEREHHEISHLPPRDWCAHCRRGRGVKGAHQRGDATHHQYPIISIDYAYIGSSPEDDERMYMEAKGRTER